MVTYLELQEAFEIRQIPFSVGALGSTMKLLRLIVCDIPATINSQRRDEKLSFYCHLPQIEQFDCPDARPQRLLECGFEVACCFLALDGDVVRSSDDLSGVYPDNGCRELLSSPPGMSYRYVTVWTKETAEVAE